MYKLLPILLFAYGLAVTTEDIYDNSYALIIGIDKYENVRSLDYAVKDAEDIQSMLIDKFHFQQDNIVLLKNEEATKTTILQEFSNITKKAESNDRVLIFFAGHGETEDLPDGGEMGYLLPVDGNNTDLYISAIEMDEIQTISLRSEAKHILYLIDACYGGIASVGARGLDAKSTPDYLQKITQYKSRQIISAGGRGEQVIEKAEWGHSAFTKNLLSGLGDSKADTDSDGIITAQELGTYLQKKVTIDSDNRQTPKTRNLSSDEGEFVFVYSENTVVIKDKSADEKLDYLISEMEELKSQQSSDDMKKWTTNRGLKALLPRQSLSEDWSEKYRYGGYGFVIATFEDAYSINLSIERNQEWGYGFAYSQIGNKTIKRLITIKDGHSITSTGVGVGVHSTYFINDDLYINMVCGVGYNMINWEDKEQNTSGKFSNIGRPSFTPQINLNIHEREQPLPIRVHLNFGIYFGYFPSSYKIDNEIVKLDDWKIRMFPVIAIGFSLPNHKP